MIRSAIVNVHGTEIKNVKITMSKLIALNGNLLAIRGNLVKFGDGVTPPCSAQFRLGQFISNQFKICGDIAQLIQFKIDQFKSEHFK